MSVSSFLLMLLGLASLDSYTAEMRQIVASTKHYVTSKERFFLSYFRIDSIPFWGQQ